MSAPVVHQPDYLEARSQQPPPHSKQAVSKSRDMSTDTAIRRGEDTRVSDPLACLHACDSDSDCLQDILLEDDLGTVGFMNLTRCVMCIV